jgi:hypothetical protein
LNNRCPELVAAEDLELRYVVGINAMTESQASEFCKMAAQKTCDIDKFLSIKTWWPQDPELRFVLSRIRRSIESALRMAQYVSCPDSPAWGRLSELLKDCEPKQLALDAALNKLAAIEACLVSVGDERYICEEIISEYHRGPTTDITWQEIYDSGKLPAIEEFEAGKTAKEPQLNEAKNRLGALRGARSEKYARFRTRLKRKVRLLWILGAILLGLVSAWGVLISASLGFAPSYIAVVALSGAIGASMSGAYKLRDELVLGSTLREFAPGMFVQPSLGAAAALFFFLALASALVAIGGTLRIGADGGSDQWAKLAVIGFVAGFSEPFLLGIVRRIASEGTSDSQSG